MALGKDVSASSQGAWVSAAKEECEIQPASDNEDERGAAAARDRRVEDIASSSGPGAGGASPSCAPAPPEPIPPFEEGQYVRLLNRGRGMYLFANENGVGVCVDRRRGMVNTAWAVQILRTTRTAHVLLRGAYGRYLSSSGNSARFGLVGRYASQVNFEFSYQVDMDWSIATGRNGSVVLFKTTNDGPMVLRANGRYLRWNTDVTFGPVNLNQLSSMMEWEVQVIPLTVERPPYQPRPPLPEIRWRERYQELVEIIFSDAWFGANGRVEYQHWMTMLHDGRSLIELGNEIASRLGNGVQFENMTLCVQAGHYGRPTPLLTDLPLRDDLVMILVFMVDSPGHRWLRFPDLACRPGYQRVGPERGLRAPTAAVGREEERVRVFAPVLTVNNLQGAALPVLDARCRVVGYIWGRSVEGLHERVSSGVGNLYILASDLTAQLGVGFRPRVLAIWYFNGKRRVLDERLQILPMGHASAKEERNENEELGADQGVDADEMVLLPDDRLGADADPEQVAARPDEEPLHSQPQEDPGTNEAALLLDILEETYGVMAKKYTEVQRLWEERAEIKRDADRMSDWADAPQKDRVRELQIDKASKVYNTMRTRADKLRDQLMKLGVDPPSPPPESRTNPDHLTPPKRRPKAT